MRVLVTIAVLAISMVAAQARELREYQTEAQAQRHCPKDSIVWSDIRGSGFFIPKGEPRYGKSPDGGYICRKEAEAKGWREFRKDAGGTD